MSRPDHTRGRLVLWKWAELVRPMTDAILAGAAAVDAKLVFADNLYVFGPPDGWMT